LKGQDLTVLKCLNVHEYEASFNIRKYMLKFHNHTVWP